MLLLSPKDVDVPFLLLLPRGDSVWMLSVWRVEFCSQDPPYCDWFREYSFCEITCSVFFAFAVILFRTVPFHMVSAFRAHDRSKKDRASDIRLVYYKVACLTSSPFRGSLCVGIVDRCSRRKARADRYRLTPTPTLTDVVLVL